MSAGAYCYVTDERPGCGGCAACLVRSGGRLFGEALRRAGGVQPRSRLWEQALAMAATGCAGENDMSTKTATPATVGYSIEERGGGCFVYFDGLDATQRSRLLTGLSLACQGATIEWRSPLSLRVSERASSNLGGAALRDELVWIARYLRDAVKAAIKAAGHKAVRG